MIRPSLLTPKSKTIKNKPSLTVKRVQIRLVAASLKQSLGFLLALLISVLAITQPAQAWLEKLVPSDEVYTVQAIDRDVAFLIDDYIYDARDFCYMQVGDKVVFFEGRYGLDYRASIYNLTGKERCEVLLRERYQPRNQNRQLD